MIRLSTSKNSWVPLFNVFDDGGRQESKEWTRPAVEFTNKFNRVQVAQYLNQNPRRLRNMRFRLGGVDVMKLTGAEMQRIFNEFWDGVQILFWRKTPGGDEARDTVFLSSFRSAEDFQPMWMQIPTDEVMDGFTALTLVFPPFPANIPHDPKELGVEVVFSFSHDAREMMVLKTESVKRTDEEKLVDKLELVLFEIANIPDNQTRIDVFRLLGNENGVMAQLAPDVADWLRSVSHVGRIAKDGDNEDAGIPPRDPQ